MSDLSLSIFGTPRRGGRPKGSTRKPPGSKLSAWVTEAEHDAVIEQARERGISVSKFIADALREKIACARLK